MVAIIDSRTMAIVFRCCFMMLLSCICLSNAFAGSEPAMVKAWEGHYQAEINSNTDNLPGSAVDEHRSITARITLNKRETEEELVIWKGTASCTASIKRHEASLVIPGTPMRTDVDVVDSRTYETPAMLQMNTEDGDYFVDLCDYEYEVKSNVTAVQPNEAGAYSTIHTTGTADENPMAVTGVTITPAGVVPDQGNHLSGGYDLAGKPAGDGGAESAKLDDIIKSAFQGLNMKVSGHVSWSLMPDLCSDGGEYTVRIVFPKPPEDYIFRENKLHSLLSPKDEYLQFEASASNRDYQDIDWIDIPEIPQSRRKEKRGVPPIEEVSQIFLWYEGIPESNESFGDYEITATLSSAERCTKPGHRKFRVFFERDGEDSPPDEPNWFYYWFQTSAGQGHYDHARYDAACDAGTDGWYNHLLDPEHIHICEGAQKEFVNDDWGIHAEGIDAFAITVMHEWQHKLNRDKWWGKFDKKHRPPGEYDPDAAEWQEYSRKRDAVDPDFDSVPNWADKHPYDSDADNDGYDDGEPSAYQASKKWRLGSADKEDWACPGKQCK